MIHWVFFMVFCLVVVSADDDGPAMLEVCKGFHPHPPRWSVTSSFAYCKWKGVECDPKNHRVTSINISGLSLGGVISPAISSLPGLSEVYVQNNNLSGEIPKLPKQVNLVYRPGNPRLRHSNKTTTGIIIGSVVGGALTLIIISVVVYLLRKSTLENGRTEDVHRALISGDTGRDDSHLYSIESLRRATNDFSQDNILGEGGFGVVYKGVQRDGTMIAVKRKDFGVVDERARPTFLVSS